MHTRSVTLETPDGPMQRAEYHEPSARDAWLRTLAWLDTHLECE